MPNYPSAQNFIPQAVAQLQSNYSLRPDAFALNRYVTVAPVDTTIFNYIVHNNDDEYRVTADEIAAATWADGTVANLNFNKGHSFTEVRTKRYHEGFAKGPYEES